MWENSHECVYCGSNDHRPSECTKIAAPSERKIFTEKNFVSTVPETIIRPILVQVCQDVANATKGTTPQFATRDMEVRNHNPAIQNHDY